MHGRHTPLHALAEPTTRAGRDPPQAEKLVHAPCEQWQAQTFEPSCAVTISLPVRITISILAGLPFAVKSASEILETWTGQEHFERLDDEPVGGMVQKGRFLGNSAHLPRASGCEVGSFVAETAGLSSAGSGYSPACLTSAAAAGLSEAQPEIAPPARDARSAPAADD